jgi:L-arabinonolactonase
LRWHDGHWWWTDPDGTAIYTWASEDGTAPVKPLRSRLPDRVASLVFCTSGRVLLGQAKWLCFAERAAPPENRQGSGQGGSLGRRPPQPGAAVDPAEPRTGVSDGACDRDGNFVFGTRNVTPEARQIGSYYQYSMQHGLRRLALPAAAMAHSIACSPDGRTLYFSDAATRRIMQCDYDAQAAKVANIRLFAEVTDAQPRGAVVDAEGCLWSAHFGAGRLAHYAPDGRLLRSLALPAPYPTRPAFGGPDHRLLLVGAMPQPGAAGGLYQLDAGGVQGLPDGLFRDSAGCP